MNRRVVARSARLSAWAIACAVSWSCEGEYRQYGATLQPDAGMRGPSAANARAGGDGDMGGAFLADRTCLPNPVLNSGECRADGACVCPVGYSGEHCETNDDDCRQNDCRNGSACVDGDKSFRCECLYGYSGAACEVDVDD